MVTDFRTMVHETVHGHSPMKPQLYQGIGAKIEEATTEMAAQLLTERLAPGWTFTSSALSPDGKVIPGSYRGFINAVVRAVSNAMGVSTKVASGYAREAAIRMRRKSGALIDNVDDYLVHFASNLPEVRTKVRRAERAIDKDFDDKIRRAKKGELKRLAGFELKTPKDIDDPVIRGEVEHERRYQKQIEAARITRDVVKELRDELRTARPY